MKKASEVKREKKKSFFLQEISNFIRQISEDDQRIKSVFVTKVELSKSGGMCHVFFSSYDSNFNPQESLEVLKLYKPSVRTAISKVMHSKYIPDIRFVYDKAKEKERRIHELLDEISKEEK